MPVDELIRSSGPILVFLACLVFGSGLIDAQS